MSAKGACYVIGTQVIGVSRAARASARMRAPAIEEGARACTQHRRMVQAAAKGPLEGTLSTYSRAHTRSLARTKVRRFTVEHYVLSLCGGGGASAGGESAREEGAHLIFGTRNRLQDLWTIRWEQR